MTRALYAVKIILCFILFVFYLPLLILPFFNHAAADDYVCGIHLHQLGFLNYQLFIYNNWGGRFAATFTGALFANNNYLYNHYYLHSLLLLLSDFLSLFFLFSILNEYVFVNNSFKNKAALFAVLFMVLMVCCIPAPRDFIFWFSSAVTYYLPLILIQVEISLFIVLLYNKNAFIKTACGIALPLLVFVINGFNECFIICQAFIFFVLIYFKIIKKFSAFVQIILIIAFISSAVLVLHAPGNANRAGIAVWKGVITGVSALMYAVAEVLWSIGSVPLFWVFAVAIFLYGNTSKDMYIHFDWIKKCTSKRWLLPAFILFFLIASTGAATAGLKGGIAPLRYLNAVSYCTIILLQVYFFIAGVMLKKRLQPIVKTQSILIFYSAVIMGLLCNTYIPDAYQSIITAPIYNSIITERENSFKKAAVTNSIAVVKDYNSALQQHLKTEYNNSSKTLLDILQQKPKLLFFQDDLSSDYSINMLKEFYKLDSISIKTR